MGIAALQKVLARLCADPALRQRYFEDPVRVGQESFGLNPCEAATCAGFLRDEMERFAKALLNKRRGMVARQIPLTVSALGAEFGSLFSQYAGNSPRPEKRSRYGDALDFLEWLEETLRDTAPVDKVQASRTAWVLDMLRYEELGLRLAVRSEKGAWIWIRLRLFRHRMRPLVERIGAGKTLEEASLGGGAGLWLLLPFSRHRLRVYLLR